MDISVNTQNTIRKAIELEYARHELACDNRYDELKKTYAKENPEIPNTNTGKIWGKLNRKDIVFLENPMAFDRISIVTSQLERNIKLLDIGFGQGMLESIISKRNDESEITGIDIATESVNSMNIKFKTKRWKFISGNIVDAKLPTNYFDCVTALEVLEHIEPHNILGVLKKIHSMLNRSGNLIISVPLNEGLEGMLFKNENPNSHTRIYTPSLIKAELKISGFNPIFDKLLYAFNRDYKIKSFIFNVLPGFHNANNIIVVSKKS